MAGKRLAKSSVDWIAFAERVPENQRHLYQAFKARSDGYLSKVLSVPENPPALDWQKYRSRIGASSLVDQFEKETKEIADFVQESKTKIEKIRAEILKWEQMIPFEHMTLEDFRDAFPDLAHNPINRPTFWPHQPEDQPGHEDDADRPKH